MDREGRGTAADARAGGAPGRFGAPPGVSRFERGRAPLLEGICSRPSREPAEGVDSRALVPFVEESILPSLPRFKAALICVAGSTLHVAIIASLALGEFGYVAAARAAETPAPAASSELSADELEELVGPVALYPDELLAIVLPAATWPLQIVQASRFLERHAADPELKPNEDWDTSVIGLLNYPDVINMMNEDLDWTWKLGDAVTNQQEDLMDAIQSFRARVDDAGNLESNENIIVTKETDEDQRIIVIESSSPEVIFVPVYQPRTVVVVRTTPHPWVWWGPWPLYFRPAAVFWTGMFVGSAVGWHMSWGRRGHSSIRVNRNVNINVNRPTRPGTPRNPNQLGGGRGGGDRWQADRGGRAGGRPGGDRIGAGGRDRVGAGGGARDRAGAGTGALDRVGAGGGARDRAGARTGARDSASARAGRGMTRGSQRSSGGSSIGRYSSGSRARASGSRGAASRGGGARAGGGGRRR